MVFKKGDRVLVTTPIDDADEVLGMEGIVLEDGNEKNCVCDFSEFGGSSYWWVHNNAIELINNDSSEDALFWRKVKREERLKERNK